MRLPPFDYHRPETLNEALKIKESLGGSALPLAGGTDLLVNLKNRLLSPSAVLSLTGIGSLREIQVQQDALVIGAGAPLVKIAEHEAVVKHFPMLRDAIMSIGAVTIQHYRGTIGGNLCSLPRCIFYNQSLFWRNSKGLCHRTGGRDCLALPGSSSCQAICSGDTVPVLAALSAQIILTSYSGSRLMALTDLFSGKGENYLNMAPEEILTEIRVPLPWGRLSTSFQKIAFRSAVDFPLVNAAAAAIVEDDKIETIKVVLSACGPGPLILKEAESLMKGQRPTIGMLQEVQRAASKAAEGVMMENAGVSKDYRTKMAGVVVKRAVKSVIGL